ncbi:hypothetical protein ARALYDRAFT_896995 [Arabidopsis lyrata subsp. lyrata]|uniref:Uncharacterized protein n=1 Tax=Arabidopsis lyrata subsp. lyrata TaxID=81972 RepID=D7L758_ARALL|nr:hypothetical protein ARALYDRAFT_896995 [Arabidopsis lyrata subsp. lyrata]
MEEERYAKAQLSPLLPTLSLTVALPEVKSFVEDLMEVEVAEGYTMAQFCDKIIDLIQVRS